MSYNWENIIWQNKDKTWGIGFYERIETNGPVDDDYDDEWDDEFDQSKFCFASIGHPDIQSASNAWSGANPGGGSILEYSREASKEIENLNEMYKCWNYPAYAKEFEAKKEKKQRAARRKKLIAELRVPGNTPVENGWYNIDFEGSRVLDAVLIRRGDWIGVLLEHKLKSGDLGKSKFMKVWDSHRRLPGEKLLWIHRSRNRAY